MTFYALVINEELNAFLLLCLPRMFFGTDDVAIVRENITPFIRCFAAVFKQSRRRIVTAFLVRGRRAVRVKTTFTISGNNKYLGIILVDIVSVGRHRRYRESNRLRARIARLGQRRIGRQILCIGTPVHHAEGECCH